MGDQATATTTPHPLYFSSFDDALSTEPRRSLGKWSPMVDQLFAKLEAPWPLDTSCTSMGGCPRQGARCSRTTGFAIVCEGGVVRDTVEPLLVAYMSLGWAMRLLVLGILVLASAPLLRVICRECFCCSGKDGPRVRRRKRAVHDSGVSNQ